MEKNARPNRPVEQSAPNDKRGFADVMRRHNRMLFRLARSILREDAEAEDALQEAYIKAYQALKSFKGEASLSTWLARIVINEAMARLRKTQRRGQILPLTPSLD